MRILVTGGANSIGDHLSPTPRALGDAVLIGNADPCLDPQLGTDRTTPCSYGQDAFVSAHRDSAGERLDGAGYSGT
jgi:hypothetical protein